MRHSRLTLTSNRESKQPLLPRRTPPLSSSGSPFANEMTPFEFDLYQTADFMTRGHSGTPPGPPDLRAA
jgi:hypothetical protein